MRLHRIAVPLLILLLFRWAVAVFPRGAGSSGSVEESEKLSRGVTAAMQAQRWGEAVDGLRNLLAAHPTNSIYWQKLAESQKALGHDQEQIAALEKFWDVSPTRAEACGDLVAAYKKTGQPEKAQQAAQRCFDLDPLNTDSIFDLALASERQGDRKRAKELYREGLRISPNYVDMEVGLARLELADGAIQSAIDRCLHAIARDPRSVDAMVTLGTAYRARGLTAQAREVLEKGLTISETYTDIHFALAAIAVDQADLASARRHYERVIELDPSGSLGKLARERLAGMKENH